MTRKTRLFTAFSVPDEFRKAVAALPHKGLEARWVHPEDLHITIRFPGDVENERIPEIEAALARVSAAPFGIEVSGLACLENKKQTALVADVKSTRKLTHLCAEVTDALVPLGFDFGARPYVPHITIARMKKGQRVEEFTGRHASKIHASWQADSFTLYRSASPDERGKRYTALRQFPLTLS